MSDPVPAWCLALCATGDVADLEHVMRSYQSAWVGPEADTPNTETVLPELEAAYDVRAGWASSRVEEWERLVDQGLTPTRARDAVDAIHHRP